MVERGCIDDIVGRKRLSSSFNNIDIDNTHVDTVPTDIDDSRVNMAPSPVVSDLQKELDKIYSSWSWRLTEPMRKIASIFTKTKQISLDDLAKSLRLKERVTIGRENIMRFLDLDLDFFLNQNAYCSGCDGKRLGPDYKPWGVSKVRHFLEDRCGLSLDAPVQGRTIESHDRVLDFWRTLIESSKLKVPFEVIHIDAHPDLWIGNGMYLASEFLHVDPGPGLAMLERKHVHSGSYLTFAIVYGWIGSLVWIHLRGSLKDLPKWDGDARSHLIQLKKRGGKSPYIRDLPTAERINGVSFKILPWHKFRTSESFDYIALSRSPSFTPLESDELITVVEGYMKQI